MAIHHIPTSSSATTGRPPWCPLSLLRAVYRPEFLDTKCMFTIHNIEYQGWANPDFSDECWRCLGAGAAPWT